MGNNPSGLQEEANTKTGLENNPPKKGHLDVKEENHEVRGAEGHDADEQISEVKVSKVGSGKYYNEIQLPSFSDDKDNHAQLTDPVSKEKNLDKYDNDVEKVILTREEVMENSSFCTKTSSDEPAHQGSTESKSDQDHMGEDFPDRSKEKSPGLLEGSEDIPSLILAVEHNVHQANAESSGAARKTVHPGANSELDTERNNLLVQAKAPEEADKCDKEFEAKGRDEIKSNLSHTELLTDDSTTEVGNISSTASVDPSGSEPKIILKTEAVTTNGGVSGTKSKCIDLTEENKSLMEESEIGKDRKGHNSTISYNSFEERKIEATNTNQSEAKATGHENEKAEEKGVVHTSYSENDYFPPKGEAGKESTSAKQSNENYAKAETILHGDYGAKGNVRRLSTESSSEDSNTCIYPQKSPSPQINITKEEKVEEPDGISIEYHHKKAAISISSQVNPTTEDDKIAHTKGSTELAYDATIPVEDKPVTYERNETETSRNPSLGLLEEEKKAIDSPSKGKEKRKSVSRLLSNCVGCGTEII